MPRGGSRSGAVHAACHLCAPLGAAGRDAECSVSFPAQAAASRPRLLSAQDTPLASAQARGWERQPNPECAAAVLALEPAVAFALCCRFPGSQSVRLTPFPAPLQAAEPVWDTAVGRTSSGLFGILVLRTWCFDRLE